MTTAGTDVWRERVQETILEPDRRIIDPHHHLWPTSTRWGIYTLNDLWSDTQSGHRIEKTVFVECGASYRTDGPAHLKSVGETEYVAHNAATSARSPDKARIAGIVSFVNLTLDHDDIAQALDAHEQAGNGLFRGIRHSGPHDSTGTLSNAGTRGPGLYRNEAFRDGVRQLGAAGYTYDTWHFFHQNRDFLDLARAAPGTTMVLDHFGTPLGAGAYAGRRDEIFQQWKRDIADIATCPNVVAKLGGLAMPDNGFGWDTRDMPPTSDEFVAAQQDYYVHTIDCFGPRRCMFESNFPVDKLSLSYHVLWNGLKKIASRYSEAEKDDLFYGTAARIYRI